MLFKFVPLRAKYELIRFWWSEVRDQGHCDKLNTNVLEQNNSNYADYVKASWNK